METIKTLGQFSNKKLAESFCERTTKASAIVLGDNGKYWVVTMANLNKAVKAGYEVAR